jgi:hypothetical protein
VARERWRSPRDGPRWLYAAPDRLRAPWRLVAFAVAWLLLQPIVDSIASPLLTRAPGIAPLRLPAWPWVAALSALGATAIALRLVDDRAWDDVAMGGAAWRRGTLARGAAVGGGALVLLSAILAATGSVLVEPVPLAPGDAASPWTRWVEAALRALWVLVPAALWEEVVFRGYLWRVADDAGRAVVARWSTAVAFGLIHALNAGATPLSIVCVVAAGLALGVVRERLSSVPAAFTAHLMWNAGMAIGLHVAVSGAPFDTPVYRSLLGASAWWSGGAWGPEGGLAALLVIGIVLFAAHRTRSLIAN